MGIRRDLGRAPAEQIRPLRPRCCACTLALPWLPRTHWIDGYALFLVAPERSPRRTTGWERGHSRRRGAADNTSVTRCRRGYPRGGTGDRVARRLASGARWTRQSIWHASTFSDQRAVRDEGARGSEWTHDSCREHEVVAFLGRTGPLGDLWPFRHREACAAQPADDGRGDIGPHAASRSGSRERDRSGWGPNRASSRPARRAATGAPAAPSALTDSTR